MMMKEIQPLFKLDFCDDTQVIENEIYIASLHRADQWILETEAEKSEIATLY